MAYSTNTPPFLMMGGQSGQPRVWGYKSADAKATVDTSGYFTNGYDLGMRDGDLILVYDTANKIWSSHTVLNTSGQTIDIGDGTNIGITTNTD